MSKSWSSVNPEKDWSSVPSEKDWSSVYTPHGTTSGSDNGDWMEPAGDDIDKLNENRRRLVDIGFERGTGAGAGGGVSKRKKRGKKRKTRKNRRTKRRHRR